MEKIITKSFPRLMGRGLHRGFITYEELSKSLGKRNSTKENLEHAFVHILDNKVTLVEKKSDYKFLKKKETSQSSEGKSMEKSDDPIRMYLREMGGVELLSREGEIAIAKRIEAGKKVMLNALAQSPIMAKKIFQWHESLEKGEILVREIIDIDTNYVEYDESNETSNEDNNIDGKASLKKKEKNVEKEKEKENSKEETASQENEEDEFNLSLAAMENEIRPKILATIANLKKNI